MTNVNPKQVDANEIDLNKSQLQGKNGQELISLPEGVLCSEASVIQMIAAIENDPNLSLADKIKLVSEHNLTPFLTGSKLERSIQLVVVVESDLSTLKIYRLDAELSASELNQDIDQVLATKPKTLLTEIKNPDLIFSADAIVGNTKPAILNQVFELFSRSKRISTITSSDGAISVTWDASVDKDVWTTNIDTVNIIRNLEQDNVFSRSDIKTALEIGVGGGAISKVLVRRLANLQTMIATDISPYALMTAKRNIELAINPKQSLELYLGKGIKSLNLSADLVVVNPPYIPSLEKDISDPYRGTGLIKEIIECGLSCLNPQNTGAAIYMGISSLAERDLLSYLENNPQVKIERIGVPIVVPLKILKVSENQRWLDFLIKEHGLVYTPQSDYQNGHEFYHAISVVKLTRN